jgi:hypothetical protein
MPAEIDTMMYTGEIPWHQLGVHLDNPATAESHMRHTDPRLTEGTYIDERLLPVAAELAEIPYIPVADAGGCTNAGTNALNGTASIGAAPGAAGAALMHRKTVTLALDLATGDMNQQEEMAELVVRGPLSQVLQLQRIGQALAIGDKSGNPKS